MVNHCVLFSFGSVQLISSAASGWNGRASLSSTFRTYSGGEQRAKLSKSSNCAAVYCNILGSLLHYLLILMNEATRAFLCLLRSGLNCKKLQNNEIPYVLLMPLLSKINTFFYFAARHTVIHPSTQSLPHRHDNDNNFSEQSLFILQLLFSRWCST